MNLDMVENMYMQRGAPFTWGCASRVLAAGLRDGGVHTHEGGGE